ncbi:MAG: hypothetical protein KDE28_14425 [Anaerolineales bacterium]|nr:hypothetical protein [Anaerolineales bacterium]
MEEIRLHPLQDGRRQLSDEEQPFEGLWLSRWGFESDALFPATAPQHDDQRYRTPSNPNSEVNAQRRFVAGIVDRKDYRCHHGQETHQEADSDGNPNHTR